MGEQKKKRAKPQASISLSPDLWAALDAIAEANDRTRSQQVAAWIRANKKAKKKLTETS